MEGRNNHFDEEWPLLQLQRLATEGKVSEIITGPLLLYEQLTICPFMSLYADYIHYRSKVWGHLDISLFLKEPLPHKSSTGSFIK